MTTYLYQTVHTLLLKTSGSGYIPLEESFGGEAGIFYFVPLIAHFFSLDPLDAAWYFLTGLVLLGAASMLAFFYMSTQSYGMRLYTSSMVFCMAYAAWSIGDVYVAYFTAISLLPWIFIVDKKKTVFQYFYFFLIGFLSYYLDFIRSFAALPLLGGCVWWIIVFYGIQQKKYKKIFLHFFFLGFGFLVGFLPIYKTLQKRDVFLSHTGYVHNSSNKMQHTFWHNIYMGFGFITNNKMLDFSDNCSFSKALEVDPHVACYDHSYENILRSQVFQLCITSPHYVLRVLFAKLGVFIYLFLLFANLGSIAAWYYPKPWYIESLYGIVLFLSSLSGFATIPAGTYTLGFMTAACLYGIHSCLYAYKRRIKN